MKNLRILTIVVPALALATAAVGLSFGLPAQAQTGCSLNMLVWEGYTDKSFVAAFEKQSGCKVTASYAGSSDEMYAKFKAGGGKTYDLVSASGDATERLYKAGVVQAIDTKKLKNFGQIFPILQKGNWNYFDGKLYGVSFAWGPNIVVYSKKDVSAAPLSWLDLFDKKYAGKISLPDNPITIADVALWLGKKDPYNLSDSDLAEVKAKLLELKPNIRKFWTTAGELANLFQSGEITIAHAWPLTAVQLNKAGFAVGTARPKEGLTGWTDSWMISKASKNSAAAYKWIDFMLSQAGQKGMMDVTGYSGGSKLGAQAVGAAKAKELFIDNPSSLQGIKMWQVPKNYDAWVKVWNEVRGQ
jgi:spermidine/putrescine-binding protein